MYSYLPLELRARVAHAKRHSSIVRPRSSVGERPCGGSTNIQNDDGHAWHETGSSELSRCESKCSQKRSERRCHVIKSRLCASDPYGRALTLKSKDITQSSNKSVSEGINKVPESLEDPILNLSRKVNELRDEPRKMELMKIIQELEFERSRLLSLTPCDP